MQTLCDADIINNCLVTQFLCPQELIKETRKQNNYFSIYLHYFVTATLVRSSALFKECYGSNLDWNLVSLSNARNTPRQIPPQEYSDNSPAILLKSNYCSEKKKKKWKKIATNWLWCSCFVLRFHCASRKLCYAYTLCLIQLLHTWG